MRDYLAMIVPALVVGSLAAQVVVHCLSLIRFTF